MDNKSNSKFTEYDKVQFLDDFSVSNNQNDLSNSSSNDNLEIENNNTSDNNNVIEENVSNDNVKNMIYGIISNRKFLICISIMTFIFTLITVCKTFMLRDKVEGYEEHYVQIEKKLSSEVVISDDTDDLGEVNVGAADELVSCIRKPLDNENIPSSINSIIKEINSYYNQSNNYFSFKYKDIYTGFSVSYNEKQNIFTASTIKAPKDIYIYEMASLGKIDLNDKLTYTSNYANTGTGILKNKKFNTKYDIKTLVEYSTVVSDNAAHNMLMDHFGRRNMLSFWKDLGTTTIFTSNSNWGATNAHDASIYMEELYRFYIEDEKYGKELMDNFFRAGPKFIRGKNNYKVANKSGWAGSAIHDVSIVFADNPYIVVALSNLGNSDSYMSYFNKANDFAYRLHTEYWKYKMDVCNNINQY